MGYNDELQGNGTKRRTVKCKHLLRSNSIINNAVEIVNSTRLQNILKSDSNVTSDDTLGVCVVVYFYSNECPFSLIAAPHFKLFAHLFPQIKMIGINSINNQWINNMYNIIGIPTVILFHNGNPIAKNEYAENTFYELSKFIILHTDLNPVDIKKIYLMELINAVNRVTPRALKPDYTLWLAWFVIIFWIVYYAITKDLWTKYVNKIQNILFGNEENEQ
ncbi:thioredoxin domain-containing protein 15-like [Sipha flava]|uniref:Thioredoxin domain-containing protein 15-like n=1 Tax=Sipha flava TaxID=143950 RepID=A0A8B8GEU0_9HEMI|nr:thioredoxin domain-containing protein 15-like [Sipha flava]